ncbi:putative bifunctional diguanylate cyclase/phosphodiesterase [Agarivorans sp.]|uniref:putative bifunctional diguanylate cyclase/phosphodiesterase n=1 Tax=Agarivorans sp. TaxID=1872412 RepID=UPI003CFCEF9B
MNRAVTSAVKVTLVYAGFSALWILFSDMAVEWLFDSAQLRALAQTYKGLAFVVTTAVLLLILVLRDNRALQKADDMDSLTGLHSLNMFIRTLNATLSQLNSSERLFVAYLDIDDFKQINEELGFERADTLLQDTAKALLKSALPGSFVSRLHADQFACFAIIEDISEVETRMREVQRLCSLSGQRYGIDVSCSVGVALFPSDGNNAKEMMISASQALNVAKQQRNTIIYHDRTLSERAMQRRQLVLDLREAIADRSLYVVYQPKYELEGLSCNGVEVLVRWNHPLHGLIAPDVFIPLAEENGLSSAISKLVIAKAAEELLASGLLSGVLNHVAVNVSATEFNNTEEMNSLSSFIESYPDFAQYVRLEITETATLTDMRKSVEVISQLQARGLSISIDDFGTGYTSLAMLKDLTVDEIKIDRSFVAELEHDARSKTIVCAVIAMANSFRINIVAEGVETESQLKVLRKIGCRQAQGFYLGKPMPITELLKHLAGQ